MTDAEAWTVIGDAFATPRNNPRRLLLLAGVHRRDRSDLMTEAEEEWKYHRPTHWAMFFSHQGLGPGTLMHTGGPTLQFPFVKGRPRIPEDYEKVPGYEAILKDCSHMRLLGIKTALHWVPVAFALKRCEAKQ